MGRPTMAVVYGAICGGCDVSLVNLGEKLAELLGSYRVVYWPAAVDGRKEVLRRISQIDVGIYMGAITSEEEADLAELVRDKSRLLVAYGTCSICGGIPGLRVLLDADGLLKEVSSTVTTTAVEPGSPEAGRLPRLLDRVRPLVDVVDADVIAPGCPPTRGVNEALTDLLLNYSMGVRLPEKVFIGERGSLCSKCERKPPDIGEIRMPGIRRLHELELAEDKCFLEQGAVCLGPVTRAACELPCVKNNMPCIGCGGPALNVDDTGLKMVSVLSSILLADRERELLEEGISRELGRLPDLIGLFYKYTLPQSLLTRLKPGGGGRGR